MSEEVAVVIDNTSAEIAAADATSAAQDARVAAAAASASAITLGTLAGQFAEASREDARAAASASGEAAEAAEEAALVAVETNTLTQDALVDFEARLTKLEQLIAERDAEEEEEPAPSTSLDGTVQQVQPQGEQPQTEEVSGETTQSAASPKRRKVGKRGR